MAASIVRTICPPNVYTLISNGNNSLSFKLPDVNGGKMAISTSQPPSDHPHYVEVLDVNPQFSGLGTAKVWWKPNGSNEHLIEAIGGSI